MPLRETGCRREKLDALRETGCHFKKLGITARTQLPTTPNGTATTRRSPNRTNSTQKRWQTSREPVASSSLTDRSILDRWDPLRSKARESATALRSEVQGKFIFRVLGARRTTYPNCSAASLGRVFHSVRDTGAGARAGAGISALAIVSAFAAGALG